MHVGLWTKGFEVFVYLSNFNYYYFVFDILYHDFYIVFVDII